MKQRADDQLCYSFMIFTCGNCHEEAFVTCNQALFLYRSAGKGEEENRTPVGRLVAVQE